MMSYISSKTDRNDFDFRWLDKHSYVYPCTMTFLLLIVSDGMCCLGHVQYLGGLRCRARGRRRRRLRLHRRWRLWHSMILMTDGVYWSASKVRIARNACTACNKYWHHLILYIQDHRYTNEVDIRSTATSITIDKYIMLSQLQASPRLETIDFIYTIAASRCASPSSIGTCKPSLTRQGYRYMVKSEPTIHNEIATLTWIPYYTTIHEYKPGNTIQYSKIHAF